MQNDQHSLVYERKNDSTYSHIRLKQHPMNDEAQRERQVRAWLEELQASQLSPREQQKRNAQKKLDLVKDLQVRAWLDELCKE